MSANDQRGRQAPFNLWKVVAVGGKRLDQSIKVSGDGHRGIGLSGIGNQPSATGSRILRLVAEMLDPELPTPAAATRHLSFSNRLPVAADSLRRPSLDIPHSLAEIPSSP